MLDLSNPAKAAISQQQLQNFGDSAIEGNKTLAIALHLHGEASEGKEGHIAPPLPYDEDNPVQMHVSGEGTEAYL